MPDRHDDVDAWLSQRISTWMDRLHLSKLTAI